VIARLMGLKTISPRDLHRWMQDQPVTAIDVNSRQSWLQARVPGALHLDPTGYSEGDLPSDKDSHLVFYCSNPMCRKAPNTARRELHAVHESTAGDTDAGRAVPAWRPDHVLPASPNEPPPVRQEPDRRGPDRAGRLCPTFLSPAVGLPGTCNQAEPGSSSCVSSSAREIVGCRRRSVISSQKRSLPSYYSSGPRASAHGSPSKPGSTGKSG